MDESQKLEAFRIGVSIIIILGVFTIGEYMIGTITEDWWMPLVAIALIKAYYVIRDYMHLPRVFIGDEEAH